MNTLNDNIKLRELIRKVKIESPDPGFTARVMDIILAGEHKKQMIQAQPVLGKSFWVLITLFVILALVFILISGSSLQGDGIISTFFNRFTFPDLTPFRVFLTKLIEKSGSLPMIVATTMISASVLILADKYFSSKHKLETWL